jgi:branched-chain amino acid transport system substrate-binding protein
MNSLCTKLAKACTYSVRQIFLGAAVSALCISQASAQDALKIGFVSTLTGPNSAIGRDLLDGFNLALKLQNGKLGGWPVQVITADDQQKPELGRQAVEKLIERDRVQLITGVVFGNILPAVAKSTLDNGGLFMSINGGAREFAGEKCNKDLFFASWQTEGPHEAIGAYAQQAGYKRVYVMAPDYSAGREMVQGFKRYYKGGIAAEVYTPLSQLDFAAELAQLRNANPDAVYIFYPGGMGVSFLKQYAAAGLSNLPLIGASFSFDQTVLPSVGDAAVGAKFSSFWGEELDNPANKEFVAAYKKEYGRAPTGYAAQAYDGARLIGAALKAIDGKVSDRERFRTALRTASFDSVRGPFKFNKNQFPVQDWYWGEIVKDKDGKSIPQIKGKVLTNHQDAFVAQCKMAG